MEFNLRKSKWLLFGGYNPHKDSVSNFVNTLEPILDTYLPSYNNFLILGDFNSETTENIIKEFCDTYNLKNLIKDPTLEKDVSFVIKWFQDNYFQMNADKCQFLASNHEAGLSIKVREEVIQCKKSIKLLGITIDNKLRFNEHEAACSC